MPRITPRPLRIAVVGVGEVARRNYLPFLSRQPDVELACWNRTAERATAAEREFGAKALPSLAAVVDWQPHSILVLTAETCRHEVGTELVRRGARRLFFEKPLVAARGQSRVTEDDFFAGRALLALAARRNCETAMVFNYRFFEQALAAKRVLAERRWGRPVAVTGLVHYACWSHCLDLVQGFAGTVTQVTALSGPVERRGDRVDPARDVAAAFVTETGAAGTIVGTGGLKWQHPLFELTFVFDHGRLHLRDLDGTLEILDGARRQHETVAFVRDESRWASYDESFRKSLGAYLQSLRDGTPPPVPGIDGLRELQVEAALRRSIAERRPVVLAKEFPLRIAPPRRTKRPAR
jgi:predicted dehydrogenase